jgi:hypothetical protein
MVRSAYTAVPTTCEAESNSSDFHEIAIFLQSPAAILMPVALLTGKVYQDGLGGLQAVLFYHWKVLEGQSQSLPSPRNCDKNAISGSRPLMSVRSIILTMVNC